MTNKTIVILIVIAIVLTFSVTGCACKHDWLPATCENPSICAKCGETAGEALGHVWLEATCAEPKTCSICGKTSGDALGHNWVDATCLSPKVCSVCGQEEGDPLGHAWKEATCIEPKICTICGDIEGSALGHKVSEWTTVTDPTCSEKGLKTGICGVCGEEVSEEISMLDHSVGEWMIETAASLDKAGTKVQRCKVCGKIIKSESYKLTEEEIASLYKKSCSSFSYKELARDPNAYKGQLVKFKGEVIQVLEASSALYYNVYRIDVTKQRYFWTDTVYVTFDGYGSSKRILEDDIVTFYGEYKGLHTYETIFGGSITIPYVHAEYIDLH